MNKWNNFLFPQILKYRLQVVQVSFIIAEANQSSWHFSSYEEANKLYAVSLPRTVENIQERS